MTVSTDRCVCGHWWAEHKPAGCYARTGIDQWCNCPAAGDPSQPTTRKPFPGGVENTVGGWVLFRPDPVGDDTPEFCDCEDADSPFRHRVGDDTPAPTAGRWTVHDGREYGVVATIFCRDGNPVEDDDVVDALNRAETAPDLAALRDAADEYEAAPDNHTARAELIYEACRVVKEYAAVGDDTPPTAPWTLAEDKATYIDIESAIRQHMQLAYDSDEANDWVTDLMAAIAPFIERAVNSRAEAAPDLTALRDALATYDRLHDAFMADRSDDIDTAVRLTAPLPPASYAVIEAARAAVAALVRGIPEADDG